MPSPNENASMPNNSMHTSTPNCESVEILFGLTPFEIYSSIGCFYDLKRFCTVGLMEMLETIQQLNKDGEDLSVYITQSESVAALVEIDRMYNVYSNFSDYVRYDVKDASWITDEILELDCVRKLHYHFMNIVNAVNKVGFMEFSTHVASALSEITTKRAYEDMVYALACVYNIYTAYIKSMYRCRAKKCVTISNN